MNGAAQARSTILMDYVCERKEKARLSEQNCYSHENQCFHKYWTQLMKNDDACTYLTMTVVRRLQLRRSPAKNKRGGPIPSTRN